MLFEPDLQTGSVEYVPVVAVQLGHLVNVLELAQTDDAGVLLFRFVFTVLVLVLADTLHCGLCKRDLVRRFAQPDVAVLLAQYDYKEAEAACH